MRMGRVSNSEIEKMKSKNTIMAVLAVIASALLFQQASSQEPAKPAAGKPPAETAMSELLEEVGYQPTELRLLMKFYATPGGTTERVFLFFGEVDNRHKIAAGGGLDAEHEFIEVVELPIADALTMLQRGEILDGKTIVALQWLAAAHR